METETLIRKYGSLIGKKVEFRYNNCDDDEPVSGRLVTISINKETERPEAHIRARKQNTPMSYHALDTVKIPLSQILTEPNTPTTPHEKIQLKELGLIPSTILKPSEVKASQGRGGGRGVSNLINRFNHGEKPAIFKLKSPAMVEKKIVTKPDVVSEKPLDENSNTEPKVMMRLKEPEEPIPAARRFSTPNFKLPRVQRLDTADGNSNTSIDENSSTDVIIQSNQEQSVEIRPTVIPRLRRTISADELPKKQVQKNLEGIQGHNYSSYLDATLFALFAYNSKMDHLLKANDHDNSVAKSVKKILRKEIVGPLRKECFVPLENIHQLRKILADVIYPNYLDYCIDVTDFLNGLFDIMGTPELLEYNSGELDFIHEIVVPIDEGDKRRHKTVQHLVEQSFEMSDIKLSKRPSNAFILTMPLSSGSLIGCEGIVPNLTLDLKPLLLQNGKKNETAIKMDLSAIICMKNDHYVAFARTGFSDVSPWIFMDSNPNESKPRVEVLGALSEDIQRLLSKIEGDDEIDGEEPGCDDFSILSHSYICIYV